MGFKDMLEQSGAKEMPARFEGAWLVNGELRYKLQGPYKVDGQVSATVEAGGDVRGHLGMKKTGDGYLTITHPMWELVIPVPPKKDGDARKFAAKVNTSAKRAAAGA